MFVTAFDANIGLLWLRALQDIHKPEPARLRRHLSALINFAKFREEKLVVYRCGLSCCTDAGLFTAIAPSLCEKFSAGGARGISG
jgi:hypothetical protein